MFAVAARFRDDEDALVANGKMWEGGLGYMEDARKILSMVSLAPARGLSNSSLDHVRNSRPSVVQALILLGYREFGIGMS